jgi:ABC-type multidrug transport system ATPase subunit
VLGRDVETWDPILLRRSIGYVIQEVGLLPHLTVGENVAIVPRLLGWDPARRIAWARELLELVGWIRTASRPRGRARSREASASGRGWRGPWARIRPSCSWTSPSAPSTP